MDVVAEYASASFTDQSGTVNNAFHASPSVLAPNPSAETGRRSRAAG